MIDLGLDTLGSHFINNIPAANARLCHKIPTFVRLLGTQLEGIKVNCVGSKMGGTKTILNKNFNLH